MNRFFFFFLISVLFFGYIILIPGISFYSKTVAESPVENKIEQLKNEIHYTQYEAIPKIYFQSLIATEDRRFYYHNGVDFIGSLRAVTVNLREKELKEGGSTIAQQLAKNLYFPLDYTLKRKIAEILMALELEKRYTKEEILEFYVNVIYYGSGYYGIYDASEGYFHKKPKDLDLTEMSILVGIPNAPSKYSLKINPELCFKRQDKVLKEMIKSGLINEKEKNEIIRKRNKYIN